MKKMLLFALLILSCVSLASAQSDDYRKNEFFAGYSLNVPIDAFEEPGHGFEAAYTYNFTRYVGAKADVSGHFRRETSNPGNVSISDDVYRYLGGVQIKDNKRDKRVKPFFHALAGGGTLRSSFRLPSTGSFSNSTTVFAVAVGVGLDIKANERISIRVGQVDYAPFFRSGARHDVRFSAGIVF